jgi:hypothetical protein
MRKVLLTTAAVLFAAGCSDGGTEPSVPTSVAVSAATPSLNALGATTMVHATVSDQKGRAITAAPLTWTASGTSVSVVPLGGDSAVVTAAANGSATVTATSGTASGSTTVQVAQTPSNVLKVGGDAETGQIGRVLTSQVRVQVRDRLNQPIVGQTVNFTVTGGSGSVSPASVTTNTDGIAATSWTLGPAVGSNSVMASFPGTSISSVTFTATGTVTAQGTIFVNTGDNQAAMVNTAVPVRPSVLVADAGGTALGGQTVNFSVRSGGGTITGATAVTNANGIATLGGWTLGPNAGPQEVLVTVAGVNATPVVIRGVGCAGGGPGTTGYNITLCFTSPMTPSQAQVFRDAAARWAQVIKGDLQDVGGAVPANSCSPGTPSMDMDYDDLLIFAIVEPIDGSGRVLGQAGFCYRRTGGLPVIGLMRFDAADVNDLETSGTLGAVFLHEMGHVIGVGSSLWTSMGFLQNPSSTSSVLDTYFSGPGAVAGFDAIGGTTYTGGQKVPVENTGGAGTANGHWRENVLRNELMTGYVANGANPMSLVTVRSLADLGYQVDLGAADNFFLTLALQGQQGGSASFIPRTFKLHNDELKLPQFTIDRAGRTTRMQ